MKIIRLLNDKDYSFELTNSELYQAYIEFIQNFRISDIYEAYDQLYGKNCEWSEKEINEVISDLTDHLDMNDNYWDEYWKEVEDAVLRRGE